MVLEIMEILVVLVPSFERNLRHFHLVTLHWSLRVEFRENSLSEGHEILHTDRGQRISFTK